MCLLGSLPYVCFTIGDKLELMSHLAPLVARHFQYTILFFTLFSRQVKYDDDDDDSINCTRVKFFMED